MEDISGEQFQSHSNVSCETLEMYKLFINHLTHWNKKINLVSASTVGQYWSRHALDSHQLSQYVPAPAKTILDLGSGAGFPGLILAIDLRKRADIKVTMVETNGKKCNFLRTIVRELKLPARVIQGRVEETAPKPYDVICARAFAPLPKLLDYAKPFWGPHTIGVFPKGSSWQQELSEAEKEWKFSSETFNSETDTEARILLVKNLTRVDAHKEPGDN